MRVQHAARLRDLPPPPLLPWIETARGVANAVKIATCSPLVAGLCFGRDDFLADMGIDRASSGGFESPVCTHARAVISVAARTARIQCFDTPWPDIP